MDKKIRGFDFLCKVFVIYFMIFWWWCEIIVYENVGKIIILVFLKYEKVDMVIYLGYFD